jgi:uncharacterized protein YegP (UPF0339 family)
LGIVSSVTGVSRLEAPGLLRLAQTLSALMPPLSCLQFLQELSSLIKEGKGTVALRFTTSKMANGQWTWRLYGANNEMVAWAGEGLVTSSGAARAAGSFKASALIARYEVYLDTASQWRWRALRSSDKVAASGEAFASRAGAERAAENVRVNAGLATGP